MTTTVRRWACAAALAAAAVTGLAAPAGAAGTGDLELVPAARDGQPQTSFTVEASEDSLRFDLVNLADEPRQGRLYAAAAADGSGGTSVGGPGSAAWIQLPDTVLELGPRETRSFTVAVDEAELRDGRLGAVVLEAQQGAVTVRVATLVSAEARTALPLGVPLWAAVAAASLIGLLLLGLWRSRRREHEPAHAVAEPQEPVAVA